MKFIKGLFYTIILLALTSGITAIRLGQITGFGSGVSAWLASASSANLRTALTDENGTGALLFDGATSPTFVTPVLGTPTSGNLANCTALPSTSITGLGSGIATWWATPSSANLRAALTDENGTGAALFDGATSASFTTPAIGAATGTSLVLSSFLNMAKGADIASATTTDIGAATGNYIDVTGTTTITGLGTVQAGTWRIVRFTGALTLTYNATSLIIPGAVNITTVAGDVAEFVSLGSGNWRCIFYQPTTVSGTGAALRQTSPTLITPVLGTPSSGTLSSCTGYTVGNLSGAATGILTWLGTSSSANLISALTDETGTGAAVFATNPVLVGPTVGNTGTAASTHITTVGTAPTVAQTGGGNGGSVGVAMEAGSTDQAGIITLTTGNSSVGTSGTITLTFNSVYVTNQPVIVLTLVKGGTDWGALATIRVTTQSLSAPVFTWNNSATGAAAALATGSTYKIAYMVIQK